MPKRLLILGGTAEGAALSRVAHKAFSGNLDIVTSLAGRTQRPRLDLAGNVRRGGFGGIEGLSNYLRRERITAVIDATHPFAETISGHAYCACLRTDTPLLRLDRPSWRLPPSARWVEVADTAAAARTVGQCARRVFLAIGRKGLSAFRASDDLFFLIRTVDPLPEAPPLTHYHHLIARPPFSKDRESALLNEHGIDTVVAKNSGGDGAWGKIAAALDLGLTIVLIARPAPEPCPATSDTNAALAWIEELL